LRATVSTQMPSRSSLYAIKRKWGSDRGAIWRHDLYQSPECKTARREVLAVHRALTAQARPSAPY
jgi:hypothetical protein